MKKIIKKICLFIGKIIKLLDKILITPIMKLFLKVSELFSNNNNNIESQSNDLLATLTNGFTMDFLDEPVVQKVKTR